MHKILICGFSGAGKSTWLKDLENKAKKLNKFKFYDLDNLIANEAQVEIFQLGNFIESVGEFKFREIEFRILKDLILSEESIVVSLGGGALNLEILKLIKNEENHTKLVFLNEDFEICYSRIKNDSNRLLSKLSESDLKKLYLKRMELYLQSDLILGPSDRNLIEGLDSLVHTLGMN